MDDRDDHGPTMKKMNENLGAPVAWPAPGSDVTTCRRARRELMFIRGV